MGDVPQFWIGIFVVIATSIGAGIGFLYRQLWRTLEALRLADETHTRGHDELVERVHAVENKQAILLEWRVGHEKRHDETVSAFDRLERSLNERLSKIDTTLEKLIMTRSTSKDP